MPKKSIPQHHIVIVGAGAIGKSALTLQFMFGEFVEVYDPTQGDSYRKKIVIEGQEEQIDILDTAGQEEFVSIRDNYYKTGEGFLLVFSLTSKPSFEELNNFHDSILRVKDIQNATEVPLLLVGNKVDLVDERVVSREEAEGLAKKLEVPYIETSAKTAENVKESFYQLIGLVKAQKKKEGAGGGGGQAAGGDGGDGGGGCCTIL